jgi:hypothetical protein
MLDNEILGGVLADGLNSSPAGPSELRERRIFREQCTVDRAGTGAADSVTGTLGSSITFCIWHVGELKLSRTYNPGVIPTIGIDSNATDGTSSEVELVIDTVKAASPPRDNGFTRSNAWQGAPAAASSENKWGRRRRNTCIPSGKREDS